MLHLQGMNRMTTANHTDPKLHFTVQNLECDTVVTLQYRVYVMKPGYLSETIHINRLAR